MDICITRRKIISTVQPLQKILEDEVIITGAHNQSSARTQNKIIEDFIINESLGTDTKPQRILANITTEIQNRSFGGATTSHLPKKESANIIRNKLYILCICKIYIYIYQEYLYCNIQFTKWLLPNCHVYVVTKLLLPNCQLPNCQLPNC